MSRSRLNKILSEIEALSKDPKYLKLKNKKRSAQDTQRYNIYLRQLSRLEKQRRELEKKLADEPAKKKQNDTYIKTKPAWRNQRQTVAHRNQTDADISRNWVRDPQRAEIAQEMHPAVRRAVVKDEPTVPETPLPTTPTRVSVNTNPGFRKPVKRTPREMLRFKEAAIKKYNTKPVQPRARPRHRMNVREESISQAAKAAMERARNAKRTMPARKPRAPTRRAAKVVQVEPKVEPLDSDESEGSWESEEYDSEDQALEQMIDDLNLDN